jgi:hypothetical protein
MRTKPVLTVVLLLAVVALAGCASAQPAAPTAAPAAQGPTALTVKGIVGQELALSLDDLKALGATKITAEHPKNGAQEYEGVSLKAVLNKAQAESGAAELLLVAGDGFESTVPFADVSACADCLVAFADDGTLTMVMPGMSSKAWVKDVLTIEVK